jgi:exopolysaccharide biosynthesis polyprenyl glycosylphosphotransferase
MKASVTQMKTKWQPRSATLRTRSFFCLLLIDLVGILGGFGVAAASRPLWLINRDWPFLFLTIVPLYFIAAINNHAYSSVNLRSSLLSVGRSLKAMTFAIMALALVGFSLKFTITWPRSVPILGFVLASGLIAVGRYYFSRHYETIIGGSPFNIMLIRDGEQPVPTGEFSVIVQAADQFDPENHDPMMYDRLAKTLRSADRVVVACAPDRREAWSHTLKGVSVQGEMIFPELGSYSPLGVDSFGSVPTLVVSAGPFDMLDRGIKRGFDLVISGIALVVLSPLLALISVCIKIDSSGPVFFRQLRIGRDNETFHIFKFRSLRHEQADSGAVRLVTKNDDRVTRVGRFIRATSIDELPQLFNIVQGRMSVVGPRPHAHSAKAADKLYWEVDPRYWHRHAIKPGLTGLAQVRGFRGETVLESDLSNRLQADLEYLENWTIWRDIQIIILTFKVLVHRNAF